VLTAPWPLPPVPEWLSFVNQLETETELAAQWRSARRGVPFGETKVQQTTAERLSLQSTLCAIWL